MEYSDSVKKVPKNVFKNHLTALLYGGIQQLRGRNFAIF